MRLIRDAFRVSWRIGLHRTNHIEKIVHNRADPIGRAVVDALAALLVDEHILIRLGEL
jgi:hypothetical protein